jgi:hypothetical protein
MRYLPGWRALLSIVLSSAIGAGLGMIHVGTVPAKGDDRVMSLTRAVYAAPEPDAELDAECPYCGETWHLRFYSDMPDQRIYRLRNGQTWEMLLNHMRYCERSIGRMLNA